MSKPTKLMLLLTVAVLLQSGNALATNITIYDNRGYSGTGIGYEDNETEPGMINNQNWDLEGFFLNGNNLSMVGGFNFQGGFIYGGHKYTSGDIFIDTTGDAWYGKDGTPPLNYGYEYAIKVNWENGTYSAYVLDGTSTLTEVGEVQNKIESNPFQLSYTDETFKASDDFEHSYSPVYNKYGVLVDWHYTVSGFDLSFLPVGTDFIAHFTISCGNDNLMGKGTTPVPEPATMLLLGTGLVGLATFGRRKLSKRERRISGNLPLRV